MGAAEGLVLSLSFSNAYRNRRVQKPRRRIKFNAWFDYLTDKVELLDLL